MSKPQYRAEVSVAGEETSERGTWSGKLDFILSAVGYAVGLGNVWRFPYKAYSNGGAMFLIPYVIFLFLAGLPMFFMEMSLGQFGSLGPISIWKAVPLFKGLGYAMVMISFLVAVYYNIIIAYTIYYTCASFTSVLPWQHCKEEWVRDYNCMERVDNYTQLLEEKKALCASLKDANLVNTTAYIGNCTGTPRAPADIYWNHVVLDISESITDGAGDFKWDITLCLLLAWIVVFVCLVKGIKSSGKVVYVTATFPYIVLTILLVRNALLPGAGDGINYYIVPQDDAAEKLSDPAIWNAAAVQIFYSLGIAFGGLETMSSYNKFKNNIFRDAVFVALMNCCTSVYAGFVIFSVIGNMAERTGLNVSEVVDSGPGLAFIAYPEGLATMPIAPLWSVLFFLMLFTLGLDSQFVMMETVITALVDEFNLNRWRFGKVTCTAVLCVACFLLGLPLCTRAGFYVMNLYDTYSAGYSLLVVALIEVIAVSWVYGFWRFSRDIQLMIGNPCCGCFRISLYVYWWPMWIIITPAMILFVLIYMGLNHTRLSNNGVPNPDWVEAMGFVMVGAALIFIPVVALMEYCKEAGWIQVFMKVLSPTEDWGPALQTDRANTRYSMAADPYTLPRYSNAGITNSAAVIDEKDAANINAGMNNGITKF